MKFILAAAPIAAALAIAAALPATAQTTTETKMSNDISMSGGVATTKTKVVHTTKRKTRHAKKVLGVKVGHKTVTHQTVRESSVDSNGNTSTSVKTK